MARAGGTRLGAQTLLVDGGGNSLGASWTIEAGRTVCLGPLFMEHYGSYANENLTDGTQSSPELFMRAVEWAAKAR